MVSLGDSIKFLKTVGPKREELFHKLGIYTIKDLLLYYPRRYEDSSKIIKIKDAVIGEKNTFKVRIISKLQSRKIRKGLSLVSFLGEDETGETEISFFNAFYLNSQIKIGSTYLVYGKANIFKGRLSISSPEIEEISQVKKLGKISPIYNLTEGLNNYSFEKLLEQVIDEDLFRENLTKEILKKYSFLGKNEAIKNIHFPSSRKSYILARQRLIYEELFLFELSILKNKFQNERRDAIKFEIYDEVYEFINNLPFELTEGQKNALDEVFEDMKKGKSINRLIQGDVGSGKTIIAIIIMYLAYLNGYQSSIMAPTEILAKQHFESFTQLLEPLGIKVKLLIGSTTKKVKMDILDNLEMGSVDILIGTHALIEENVKFRKLGLNVIDEQHRFGVVQRNRLQNKNKDAATIIMSATPIPRSLSLVLYADLDISVIKTMPKGRQKIDTIAINETMEEKSLAFIKKEIDSGRQAYVICALIEENEDYEELKSVEEVYEKLSDYFKEYKVALLHGKMKADEKNKIMEDFANGEINLLVSTTVIEVGINVPNATVMMIYNAERFGLSTLHQLRGRVGRGEYKSYCILYNLGKTEISWERMKIMTESNDGFYIANKDLELRGFGDILGTRQSGMPNLRLADPFRDTEILKYATDDAKNILREDPNLDGNKYSYLNKEITDFYSDLN
ncbi:ATP-dependent DNA helicase RecG [Peptoniphilus sp. MSJ-1]|uniref:ATP-dependent DNA helicase RecG n=1 Tax=Peptoniphilus ovalis TaxID=2841503 RepID=A0ABS6FG04_9FIRM|nr:ATP-dependent DNA helicase RecG [Peptoniphilus ovalis]MBU5669110.1 ATP-dependent DNA helicase RecG [Peptoniphilus ovalis]